jgi:mono/diheme cytochrome c family protein
MPRTASIAFAALAIFSLSLPAFAADVAAGKDLAARWCASCHLIAADQNPVPTVAPSFAAIGRRPGFDVNRLAKSMQFPHPAMPGRELAREQADDIAAYIATLAK